MVLGTSGGHHGPSGMKKEGDVGKGQAGNGDQVREALVGIEKALTLIQSEMRATESSDQGRDKT